jgi:hypothetical protein
MENGSPGDFSSFVFAHLANGSLSLICLLKKKQMEFIRFKMD